MNEVGKLEIIVSGPPEKESAGLDARQIESV
jgi:hypothetical protein